MEERRLDLRKNVFNKTQYIKTIDTDFNELGVTSITEDLQIQPDTEEFWNMTRKDVGLIDFYNDVFCEVVLSSDYDIKESPFGAYTSDIEFRPFLCCVIPLIVVFKNYDECLKDAGFDMFDDVFDTSFYKTDDLDRKFNIIKSKKRKIFHHKKQ